MARFVMEAAKKPSSKVAVRDPDSEGEIAVRLLEDHGFNRRKQTPQNGQWEFRCPFHEEPGAPTAKESTKFYLNARTSQYMCMSGHCGEQGNLKTLERFFGIEDGEDTALSARYKNKNTSLQEFEGHLNQEHRTFLQREKGLSDKTINRFRIGFDPNRKAYVIPYLEFNRPTAFRFYDPIQRGTDDKGRAIYGGPNGSKYWWESAEDSIATPEDDIILRLFNRSDSNGDERGQVFICEGEWKAMLLAQWGYKAVGLPGVNGLKPEWAQFFMNARQVFVVMDNDNFEFHKREDCRKCQNMYGSACVGHNPGQEGAEKIMDFFGFRAHNVVLPLPEGQKKTDINEYVTRDGGDKMGFIKLVLGESGSTHYHAKSLAEIRNDPPDETVFLVDQLLPLGGRLLVTGAPKVGKSIFIENLVLSLAAGIPFLHKFSMANHKLAPGHRVLLLDRELSKRSLFDRLNALIGDRPGYSVADEKLLIDHDFQLALDQPGAAEDLIGLIRENNAEVVVLDTAYKFFANGDMESSSGLSKSFAAIDKAIKETGASFILTHHHRKGSNDKNEAPSADSVVGSFLWTGWANATVLLNFKNRSVKDPYTTVASFVAFRDTAAPDPLLLKRSKTSIGYTAIEDYSFDDEDGDNAGKNEFVVTNRPKLTAESLADLLMQAVPIEENEFMHIAAAHFKMKPENVKTTLLDVYDRSKDFVIDGKHPRILRYAHDKVEQTYGGGDTDKFDGVIDGQITIEDVLAA